MNTAKRLKSLNYSLPPCTKVTCLRVSDHSFDNHGPIDLFSGGKRS